MKFGSLFAGIGGLDLGLERAGMTCAWQVEYNEFCQTVLAKHWPDVQRYTDVKDVEWGTLDRVDVICGGYPCQPFSLAGKRLAHDDERHLWPYFFDAICELQPRFALLENVAGHLSLGFDRVLADLASVGFDAEWEMLRASAVGAPHQRPRLFVIAYPHSSGLAGRCFSETVQQAQRDLPRGFGKAGTNWEMPPEVSGVGYGLPDWVDRIRSVGNAVVPQVGEFVGRQIMEVGRVAMV